MSERVLNGDRAAELWEAVKNRSLPVKVLTRAEYEALSEEEKAKDILYITLGEGAESPPAENVYSTEETRIGTWIDGKPLYRRTFKYTFEKSASSGSGFYSVGEIADLADVTFTSGIIQYDDGEYINALPLSQPYASVFFIGEAVIIAMIGNGEDITIPWGAIATVICEYTKTTG